MSAPAKTASKAAVNLPGYERLVGFDDESARTGYRGPER
jgi:hypothetical protein